MSLARPNLVLLSSKIASDASLLQLLTRNPRITLSETHLPDGQRQHGASSTSNNQNRVNNNNHVNPSKPSSRSIIAYQLLKSKSFDLKNCKHLILNKLRVMTLIRRNVQRPTEQRNCNDTYGCVACMGWTGLFNFDLFLWFLKTASMVNCREIKNKTLLVE